AEIDFGGLRLARAKVATGASGSLIEFSRPTLAPCEELEVHVAAADFRVEGLGNSNCRSMQFDGDAGALRLDFQGEWQYTGDTDVTIKIGLGALRLYIPRGMGVSVQLDRFLASFDQAGLIKRGNMYRSRNYDQSTTRINFEIDAAFGDIDIIWID
ncbi:MAG: cell wall-active antibiotics response protein, partial [Gemmatimonadota bacterium]|nr:cell wall-active antibiotics response protein [Gemmatimonadota bacterium]